MHEAFRSDEMKKVQAARDVASQKKRMTLGAFAQIQFAMYDAHHADFNSHTMRRLEDEVKGFLEILGDLKNTEDHLMVALSGSSEPLPIGSPAEEIQGAAPKAAWDDLKEANEEVKKSPADPAEDDG
jgi:hypothetical protein